MLPKHELIQVAGMGVIRHVIDGVVRAEFPLKHEDQYRALVHDELGRELPKTEIRADAPAAPSVDDLVASRVAAFLVDPEKLYELLSKAKAAKGIKTNGDDQAQP